MFDMTEEIVFSEPSSAFRLSVSNPAGDYVVFYSADSVAYSDDVITTSVQEIVFARKDITLNFGICFVKTELKLLDH